MTAFNGYPISILFAVLLHGSVLAALFYFQQANTEVLDVIRPPSVKANLVGENPQVRNALVEQQQQQRRVEEQRAAQRRQEEQRQAEARQQEEQQRQAEAEAERRAEAERNALRERQNQERQQAEQRQAEEQRQREEQQRQQREEEQRQQQAEQAAQQERQRQEQALQAQRDAEASQIAAQESEAVMSYTSVIHDLVQQQWSRPPSARNGMVVVLRITMLPTGDITDVQVVQSSGDFAFDRAAETAVLRVNRFTELQGMPYAVFDRNFRSFLLTFRPEDLLN